MKIIQRGRAWLRRRLQGLDNVVRGRDYPAMMNVPEANQETLRFLRESLRSQAVTRVAEIGVYEGETSEQIARLLGDGGTLDLFDFQERVDDVAARLRRVGLENFRVYGNTHKTFDSYNWSLMRLLEENDTPIYDYVFIDGTHTWPIDALTFFLTDRLLKVGGHIDFDDYTWSLAASATMNPIVFPRTAQNFTDEQIHEQHVRLIVDLLVKRSARYREVLKDKIYEKVRAEDGDG